VSRRYPSADNAWRWYEKTRVKIERSPGLDYEQRGQKVDSQPAPENPNLEKLSDIWLLEEVFTEAVELLAMAVAGHLDDWDCDTHEWKWKEGEIWRTWRTVKARVGNPEPDTRREVKALQLAAAAIEEKLDDRGLLIMNPVRD